MRKSVFACCVVVLATLMLAGSVGATTISFWHNFGGLEKEVVDSMIETWNRANPDIQVEGTYVSAQGRGGLVLQEKLLTAIAGGTPPDVAYFNRHSTASWAVRDSFVSLNSYMEASGLNSDDYLPFALKESTWKGNVYSLPFNTDTRGLFWNKEMFAEVGLDPETPPTNIEQLDLYAEKLTKLDARGRLERIGFVPWRAQGLFYTWALSFGGQVYDEVNQKCTATDPKIIEMLHWMQSYSKKYDISKIDTFSSAFGAQEQNPLYTGQVAMEINGVWELASIERYAPNLQFGVSHIPYPHSGRNATYSGGWSVVIPRGAKHPEEAFEFARWFAGEEGQYIYCSNTSSIPTNVGTIERLQETATPNWQMFLDLLSVASGRPVTPEIDLLKQEDAINYDLVIHLKKTPEQAMADLEAKVNKAMERWK
ncbi:MAG: ABC transporter substrate-binding protein [Firmicutes bacterium]|nr:ABC transporter substrate-binding protein [Bacillota bacterium]